jgi:hypothetical protein
VLDNHRPLPVMRLEPAAQHDVQNRAGIVGLPEAVRRQGAEVDLRVKQGAEKVGVLRRQSLGETSAERRNGYRIRHR